MGPVYAYRDKLFWRSPGFRYGSEHELRVLGQRLDAGSAPAGVSRPTNAHVPEFGGWTMLVGVGFPSPGCWEVTGEYRGQTLTFVVEVPKPEPNYDCDSHGFGLECSVFGDWVVRSVDPARFVVAANVVDDDSTHVFLATGGLPHFPEPIFGTGNVVVSSDLKAMRLEGGNGAPLIINLDGASHSHYWGGKFVSLDQVPQLRMAPVCDHVEGSCWETDDGWSVTFPH